MEARRVRIAVARGEDGLWLRGFATERTAGVASPRRGFTTEPNPEDALRPRLAAGDSDPARFPGAHEDCEHRQRGRSSLPGRSKSPQRVASEPLAVVAGAQQPQCHGSAPGPDRRRERRRRIVASRFCDRANRRRGESTSRIHDRAKPRRRTSSAPRSRRFGPGAVPRCT